MNIEIIRMCNGPKKVKTRQQSAYDEKYSKLLCGYENRDMREG